MGSRLKKIQIMLELHFYMTKASSLCHLVENESSTKLNVWVCFSGAGTLTSGCLTLAKHVGLGQQARRQQYY